MHGAVFYKHGGLDVLKYVDDLPMPEPGPGEVRLKMQAVALNRLDLWVRIGWKGLDLPMPHVTCSDGAGLVDAIGAGVTGYVPGDRVCIDPTIIPPDDPAWLTGLENQGQLAILGEHVPGVGADYAVVPARNLLKMPDHVSFANAAAAGLVYLTAWHSLITRGHLRAGESVLIVGAGGGVSTVSLQIAKFAGCKVYVVGSDAEKCVRARELGADVTINRQETPSWSKVLYQMTNKRGVDVVVDNVGAATLNDSLRSARVGGRILIVGGTSGPQVEINVAQIFSRQIAIIGSMMGPHQDYITVMNLVFDGTFKPVIGATLPLSEFKEGHRLLEEGQVFGKVVLNVGS